MNALRLLYLFRVHVIFVVSLLLSFTLYFSNESNAVKTVQADIADIISIVLSPKNIVEQVQYGVFSPESVESLMRIMDGVFVPFVVGNTTLPGSVRRSLTSQMHRFMANLTETSHSAHGRTVLYLPQEAVDLSDADKVVKDKDGTINC